MVPAKWKPPVAAASAAPRRAASRRLPPGEASCGGSGGTLGSKRRAPHRGRQLPARGERGGSCSIRSHRTFRYLLIAARVVILGADSRRPGQRPQSQGQHVPLAARAARSRWRIRYFPRQRFGSVLALQLACSCGGATPQLCACAVSWHPRRLTACVPPLTCRLTAWPRGASATCTTTWPLAPPMRHQLRPMMTRPSRQLLQQP
jgi:hypothetical protein